MRCLCLWQVGTPREFSEGGVTDIAEILDADFAGEKAICGEIAEQREESHALAQARIGGGVLAAGNGVEDLFALFDGAADIVRPKAIRAGRIEPHNSSAQLELVLGVFAGEQVNELRRASFHGSTGLIVSGDDGITQCLERLVLMSGEKFWLVAAGRSGSFFRV